MKKLIFSLILMLIVSVSFAQFGGIGRTTVSKVVGLQDSLNTKMSQTQADLRYPQIEDSVAGYTAAEVDIILNNRFAFIPYVFWPQNEASGLPINNTGNTTENVIFTKVIPANTLKLNSRLDVVGAMSFNSNTNSKMFRLYINDVLVYVFGSNSVAGTFSKFYMSIWNRNSLSAQFVGNNANQSGAIVAWAGGNSGSTGNTASFNFGAEATIKITAQCVTAGTDNIRLEALQIIVNP